VQQTGEDASASASDLVLFLDSLTKEGRALVSSHSLRAEGFSPLLQQLAAAAREELALEVPDYSPETANWAARLFYQLCQFVVCRDVGEKTIAQVCQTPCPEPRSPVTDWSADLMFRHLPRLFQLARHLSQGDPLLDYMRQIATAWPLSSVGIPGLTDFKIDSFIDHPALRRLYLDRIIANGDAARLGDARVDDSLRVDLGLHRELAPAACAAILFGNGHDTH
jgi:hypothetical protein